MNNDIESREVWDTSLANTLVGKVLLVGITNVGDDGSVINQQQLFGRVLSTHPQNGILLSLLGQRTGEKFNLPPDTRSINAAGLGEYRLRSTGEVLVNPDYTATFSVHKQRQENNL
jgi:hypothetical protein